MADESIALMAHLMRRAGFGAPYAELEARAKKGYEATVEELLHPEAQPDLDQDIMLRYKAEWVKPQFGRGDAKFDEYPELSIEDWHKKRDLWID